MESKLLFQAEAKARQRDGARVSAQRSRGADGKLTQGSHHGDEPGKPRSGAGRAMTQAASAVGNSSPMCRLIGVDRYREWRYI